MPRKFYRWSDELNELLLREYDKRSATMGATQFDRWFADNHCQSTSVAVGKHRQMLLRRRKTVVVISTRARYLRIGEVKSRRLLPRLNMPKQQDLAARMGVSDSVVSRLLVRAEGTRESKQKMADALEWPLARVEELVAP